MNKKTVALLVLVPVLVMGLFAAGDVKAADQSQSMPSLVSAIAAKFGLKTQDVQSVFDEHRGRMSAQRDARNQERLSGLVKAGNITEEQKTLILNKQKELRAQHDKMRSEMQALTEDERLKKRNEHHAAMEKKHEELLAWAKNNGIDPQLILGFRHGMGNFNK